MKSSRMKSLMLTSTTVAEYDIIGLFHNPPILNTTLTDWAAGVNTSADAMITVCLCGAMVYTGGAGALRENTVNFAVVLPRGEAEEVTL